MPYEFHLQHSDAWNIVLIHVCSIICQDPNVRLIRELKAEIKRLKMIIEDGHLVSIFSTFVHISCLCVQYIHTYMNLLPACMC